MKLRSYNLLFVLFVCLSLTACGFHLRGEEPLPPQLTTLYIDSATYAPLTLALQHELKSAGVNVVSSAEASPITLQILTVNFSQSIANISANTLVRTYNLIYIVKFQLLNKAKKVIYGPVGVKVHSSYAVSANQILGDDSQLVTQKGLMRREAIGLIFSRLGSDDVRNALS